MKHSKLFIACAWLAVSALGAGPARTGQSPADPGWPRVFTQGGRVLTVHQPQVDYWKNYVYLHYRCAISVKAGPAAKESLGVAEVDAVTAVDHAARSVLLTTTKRELRFPNRSAPEADALRAVVDEMKPVSELITVSLDRVLAYANPEELPQQRAVDVSVAPPAIFASSSPAILVMFLGEPRLKPVAKGRTDLMFALNTNWDLFYDAAGGRYYLLDQDHWLTAADVKGPWAAAPKLPASLSSLPADDNWADVRRNIPGKAVKSAPKVFVSTQPAELILTDGEPDFTPIAGTRLMRVANTESLLFLNAADATFYFLAAGRWFRARALSGPWSAASTDLPADFAKIPDSDPAAFVKASVPGTEEAKDAVLLASVPSVTAVSTAATPVTVAYSGKPQFKPVAGTAVQYAVNTPNAVLLVDGRYYCCDQGVWFTSAGASGPWSLCTSVPAAIYTIPPSCPLHNVTYVVVQSASPTNVIYCQTAGYSGEYVAASGVVMFGAGMVLGALIADDHDDFYYYYPPPVHYSYGCGAVYHHGYGGYYSATHVAYGPYGGVSRTAAYNPYTGTYVRGASAYGPYGSTSVRQAYNPYTGGYAQGARVNTAAGSAGRFSATRDGESAWGGYRTSAYGSAAGVKTSEGSGAVAWDTQRGEGAVAKSKDGDFYAAKDGTVYKRDEDGGWSKNTGSGWESVDRPAPERTPGARPAPTASGTAERGTSAAAVRQPSAEPVSAPSRTVARDPSASATRAPSVAPQNAAPRESSRSLETQARFRERGNSLSAGVRNWRSSSGGTGGRSFGGGRGRR